MHHATRSISEGAMMSALVGVVLLINRQFAGLLEYALYWLLSLPIIIYTVKYGWKKAMMPCTAMMVLAFMIALPTTMFYLASALLCGVVYGHGVQKGHSNVWLLTRCAWLTLASYFITMVLFAQVFGYDPQDDIIIAQRLMEMLSISSLNLGQVAFMAALLISVITAFLQTFCVHLLAVVLLTRMRLKAPQLKPIHTWQLPKWFGWLSICIWLLFSLKNVLKLEGNSLVLCTAVYVLDLAVLSAQGMLDVLRLAVVLHKRWLGSLGVLAVLVSLLWTPMRIFIAWYGIFRILYLA